MERGKPAVAPSLLSGDFSRLGEEADRIAASGAPWIHLDVMDGNFVPPITFGAKAAADLRPRSRLVFDVHLMTAAPERHFADFAKAGADWITFHAEAAVHAHRFLDTIHGLGKKAGLAIVPGTPVSAIEPLLPFADLVLVMTVNPGWGGQEIIPECLEKVKTLADIRRARGFAYLVSVDGGVNQTTAPRAAAAGADVLVAGAAFFSAPNPAAFVNAIQNPVNAV